MLNPDYRDILSIFAEEQVKFLLVGAYALAVHGYVRATGDIDLWIQAEPANARRVMRALARFGAPLSQVTEEDFSKPEIVFQIGLEPRRIDILTLIDGVEFTQAWPERLTLELEGLTVPVLSRAHLKENKRASGRAKDLADLAWLEEQDTEE